MPRNKTRGTSWRRSCSFPGYSDRGCLVGRGFGGTAGVHERAGVSAQPFPDRMAAVWVGRHKGGEQGEVVIYASLVGVTGLLEMS